MFTNTKAFSSFSVDDIEKARHFYGQTLGLKLSDSMGGLELQTKGNNAIFVYLKDNHVPATFTILNFMVDDIEAAVDKLTASGVRFEKYTEPELETNEKGISDGGDQGPKMAWFKDPAGNFLSVMQVP